MLYYDYGYYKCAWCQQIMLYKEREDHIEMMCPTRREDIIQRLVSQLDEVLDA